MGRRHDLRPSLRQDQEGISDLLDNILVVAEVADLKANPDQPARAWWWRPAWTPAAGRWRRCWCDGHAGTGDAVVVGTWEKIKAMFNEHGRTSRWPARPPPRRSSAWVSPGRTPGGGEG